MFRLTKFLGLLLSFTVPVSFAVAECTKTMAWNEDAPFSFSSPAIMSKPVGSNIDTANAVFEKLDCSLRFIKMPWARAMAEMKEGRIDLVARAYKNAHRQQFAHFSTVELYSPNMLFLRNEIDPSGKISALPDLIKYQLRLGTQIDVFYGHEFSKLMESKDFSRLVHVNTSRAALWNMMAKGRIDAVIADIRSGTVELKQLGIQNLVKNSGVVVTNTPSFFIFSKETVTPKFVAEFDRVLLQLKELGVISSIETTYSD